MLQSIAEVEKKSPNWYVPEASLSYDDQEWLENSYPSTKANNEQEYNHTNAIVSLNGSVNGSGKLKENYIKTSKKLEAIERISLCTYLTPPLVISTYLTQIFGLSSEHPEHWLYIAQYYTPKSISSVLRKMIKTSERGAVKLKSPPAYFTSVLKRFHKPRKHLRKKRHDNT